MTQEEKFYSKYTCIKNHLDENAGWDGCMFETHGEEIEEVLKYANELDGKKRTQVWTIADADGRMFIQAGYWHMNRLGYLITETHWEDTNEQYVCEGGFGEELYYITKDEVETDEAWYDLIHKQLSLPPFHDLFDGDEIKEEYAEYFEDEFEIELLHDNICSSNKDNFELLCEQMKLEEEMIELAKEKLGSPFYKIEGINYGIKLTYFEDFKKMTEDAFKETFSLEFSDFE